MKISTVLASAALVFSSALASALPTYEGSTSSSTGFDGYNMTTAGYYLWNNESDPSQWHLRWTGIDAEKNRVKWGGSLRFMNSNLGTVSSFSFEKRDDYAVEYDNAFDGSDAFAWDAVTNNDGGYDGIDFTLSDDTELMLFSLGSNLFNGLDSGDSENVFIGDSMSGTQMYTTSRNGMTYQNFAVEVAVPEPGSLLLLGVGLIGLGLSRRRFS